MVSQHLPKTIPALIKSYSVDAEKSEVMLTMPNVDAHIAKSIESEINRLNTEKPDSFVEFNNEGGNINLKIKSHDVAHLALNVARIMTRRVNEFSDGEIHSFKYAAPEDIQSVLGELKEVAKNPNAKLAIDNLISAAKQIERQ